MEKVILICGKICSGKTHYAKQLQKQYPAVLLSTDEATFDLIENAQGDFYNIFTQRVNRYLRKKAVEINKAGANVILDWGFWTRKDRMEISEYFRMNQVPYEWHYMDVEDSVWKQNIAQRNKAVQSGNGGSDFYMDEGLLNKLLSLFEPPAKEEVDVWHTENRELEP